MMKRVLILLAFAYCVVGMSAQGFMRAIPKYDFIDIKKNELRFPADTGNMRTFFEKLDNLVLCRTGKINILHIGGSHVQADVFSNRVRRNLDSLNLDFKSSRGLVFPFKIAKTNNPPNYKVTYTGKWASSRILKRSNEIQELGVMGIAVQAQSPDATMHIRLNRDTTERWVCTDLKVIGYADSAYSYPVLIRPDSTIHRAIYNILDDVYEFELESPVDSFTIGFEQTDSVFHPFTLSGILAENRSEGITYNAVGINGASVPSWLNCEKFDKELPLVKPDLVVFGIGINDAVVPNFNDSIFIDNYSKLVNKILTISPNCAFIFITNNDSYRKKKGVYSVNTNGEIVRKAFYRLAEKYNAAVWDQFEIMGGLRSMQKWETKGLARRDKIHFTPEGYNLLGDMFYNALIKSYLNH